MVIVIGVVIIVMVFSVVILIYEKYGIFNVEEIRRLRG